MAIQLFKLVVESTLTETQYFTTLTTPITIGTTATDLPASNFLSGAGTTVSTFTTATSNGYYSLVIGGALQQSGLYTVSGSGLTLTLTAGTTPIPLSTPISLAVTESTVIT